MKKAYELAYTTAKLFSKTDDPHIDCIDILDWIKPRSFHCGQSLSVGSRPKGNGNGFPLE